VTMKADTGGLSGRPGTVSALGTRGRVEWRGEATGNFLFTGRHGSNIKDCVCFRAEAPEGPE
jgi:hypothetical protein